MTPQSTPGFHYTKQPLLTQNTTHVTITNSKKLKKNKCQGKHKKIKCVIVGDQAVGKTSLAVSYSNDSFPSEYVPTAYDNYNVQVQVNGKPVRVELCDTAGEDGLNPLRHLCYPGSDVFMLCFSIVKPNSFISACTRWADELSRLGAAVVLVGTQADLATNVDVINRLRQFGQRPVMQSEARGLAERLNAPYIETSALACTHLKEAFDTAIVIALKRQKRKTRPWMKLLCCIR
ncbi:rho-related GTP-binding protein RhoU-like [Diorhabda sublineata]|uniref:rho-related GTP-binding protein RhoU-like n=1 Tax=Diorhabda sublineata TaxID=1163346 RepID=UPI0024E04E82|nr:rho-related GTP-binding protein RhoU-like [Diorhabda sublineata]